MKTNLNSLRNKYLQKVLFDASFPRTAYMEDSTHTTVYSESQVSYTNMSNTDVS